MTERHHLLSWTAHATSLVCTATLCSASFSLVGVLYCQALELFRPAITHGKLPKDTSKCKLEYPKIDAPTFQLVDHLLN